MAEMKVLGEKLKRWNPCGVCGTQQPCKVDILL